MNFRIKYVYDKQNKRDKGYEIMDSYGEYQVYEIEPEFDTSMFEMENQSIDEFLDDFPDDIPKTEYLERTNKQNTKTHKEISEDVSHEVFPVLVQPQMPNKSYEKNVRWVTKEEPMYDYDNADERLSRNTIGTALADFLNFDVDKFINGAYSINWENYNNRDEYESAKNGAIDFISGSQISGWIKTPGQDLNNLYTRYLITKTVAHGSNEKDEGHIPYFIRMFPEMLIDFDKWEYNEDGIAEIKNLQERVTRFCEKVFMDNKKMDKRVALERYKQEIEPINSKELKNRVKKDWFTPITLEYALSEEIYAMIKGNVNFFKCERCGLYSVSKDSRASLCNRMIYHGNMYKKDQKKNIVTNEEYYYVCKNFEHRQRKYTKPKEHIITTITVSERKRLYNLIDSFKQFVKKYAPEITEAFAILVDKHEESYIKKSDDTDDYDEKLKLANEYLQLLIDGTNEIIRKYDDRINKDNLFDRKKNKEIKSLEGNVFKSK